MHYKVNEDEFPGTLKGLTAAIKLAREYGESGKLDVLKVDGDKVTVAYHVDKQPPKPPRKGKNITNEAAYKKSQK